MNINLANPGENGETIADVLEESFEIVSATLPIMTPPYLVPELEDDAWQIGAYQVWWPTRSGHFVYVDSEGVPNYSSFIPNNLTRVE